MTMNRIQFQPGLSMHEFFDLYGTEAKCQEALQAARWPVASSARTVAARLEPVSCATGCPTGSVARAIANAA